MEKKTPEYTRRAIEKYRSKKYQFVVAVPLEYKEILKNSIDNSVNAYVNELITADLKRRGLLPDENIAAVQDTEETEFPFN